MTALLVAAVTLLYSFQSLFCKLFSQKHSGSGRPMTSTVFSISYGIFAGTVTLILAGFRFSPSPRTLVIGLINAAALLVFNTGMIEAARSGSYSFQMLCLLFGGIVPPLVHEVIFLGGVLNAIQIAAIVMMLFSFVLMNLKGLTLKGSSRKFLFWCGAVFASNGAYSILMNLQQRVTGGAERSEMIILTYLGMALFYISWQGIRNRKALAQGFRMGKESVIPLLLCCVSATAAVHLMMYLLTLMEASLLYTIDNGGVLVLSVLYSCILFKEKLNPAQTAGIILAAASIMMLSLA